MPGPLSALPGDLRDHVAFANRLADASRAIIRRHVGQRRPSGSQPFETKEDASPVTVLDREVEHEIRSLISRDHPTHGILGEEFDPTGLDRDLVWVVDPIDGTKPFIGGIPVYGTLIALAWRGTPILGVIDHPYTNERWLGANGLGTTLNGALVETYRGRRLEQSVMFTGNPEPFLGAERAAFYRLRRHVNFCVYGANCYGYGCIANGQMDIGIETGHDPFDFCALVPVVTNAGGRITDWEGKPLTIHSGKRYLATGNPEHHDRILEILNGLSQSA